jgi:hypothetical protein
MCVEQGLLACRGLLEKPNDMYRFPGLLTAFSSGKKKPVRISNGASCKGKPRKKIPSE